ncbi:MAG: choice-of-anchor B family protein [Planctomycetes bacterium]|nr:choice-of-anchor B family protein [Planctomycetota bacterium]
MRNLSSSAALLAALSLPALAQGFQCTLLGTHDQHAPYNCMWGYVAPNGKEYALLGSQSGTVVIDCSIPTAPVERGWFPWMTSLWREIRTYGHYVYVVTEAAGGFQIIDMQNPDAPVNLGIFGAQYYGNAHNLGVDLGTGKLYIVGTNNGTAVFDVAANPANPPFLGFALGSGNSNYIHDVTLENGYGYAGMIQSGRLRIWDLSTFPPTTLSDAITPAAFTHNAWPSANGNITVTTDERAGSVIRFYDTTVKTAPVPLSQMTVATNTIPHNAYIKGNIAHVSWYVEGYQAVDFSDPTTPVVVASYDTLPGAASGFTGAWGCFPYLPSGNVYISDMVTGLYVLRPHLTDLAVAHVPLADTPFEHQAYVVEADLTGSNPVQTVTLRYRLDGGAEQAVVMTPTAVPGRWRGTIPAQDAVRNVTYHIDAVDSVAARRSPRLGEHRFLVGTRVVRWQDDFEGADTWSTGGTGNDWELGAPYGRVGSSLSLGWQDPMRATSGQNVRGTDLGSATANGAYLASANSWLQSPAIPTNGVSGLRLRYRRWLSVATADTARLLVNGQQLFSAATGLYDTEWQWIEHDLSAVPGIATSATIRFELQTSANNAAGGWNIDDVQLVTLHDAAPPIVYGVGTPGTGAVVPQLTLSAPALLGTTTQVQGSAMLANSIALLALNLAPADLPVLGVQLLVDANAAAVLSAAISPSGTASWPFSAPSSLALDNVWLYAQALPLDPAGPAGLFAASAGLRFRTCRSAP